MISIQTYIDISIDKVVSQLYNGDRYTGDTCSYEVSTIIHYHLRVLRFTTMQKMWDKKLQFLVVGLVVKYEITLADLKVKPEYSGTTRSMALPGFCGLQDISSYDTHHAGYMSFYVRIVHISALTDSFLVHKWPKTKNNWPYHHMEHLRFEK